MNASAMPTTAPRERTNAAEQNRRDAVVIARVLRQVSDVGESRCCRGRCPARVLLAIHEGLVSGAADVRVRRGSRPESFAPP